MCVLFTVSLNLRRYLIYICYILNYVIKDNAGRYGSLNNIQANKDQIHF
ncbi:unnamed protein product, partial [Callosobruchus maculatus]